MKRDDTKYSCKVCRKTNELPNVGRAALSDHQLGKIYIENIKKIHSFFSIKKVAAASPVVDTHHSSISGSSQQTIHGAVTYASVVNAEIRWVLKCVVAGYSNNSNRAMSVFFPVMFPANYRLGPDKLHYSINFGLGSFFKGKLMHDVQNSNYYSLSFDESFNRVTQSSEMDLMVRYLNHSDYLVKTR